MKVVIGLRAEDGTEYVLERIEEMKAAGISTEDNEDVVTDMWRANHWVTIGVGVAGYYQR